MKVIVKSKDSKFNTDIGEAFIEVSPDGSKACLQAVMNKTGKVIKYCSFDTENPFDLTKMNDDIDYLKEQVKMINDRIDNLEITGGGSGIYVGSDNPNATCIWYDTDIDDDLENLKNKD
jgi:hypothetical protein